MQGKQQALSESSHDECTWPVCFVVKQRCITLHVEERTVTIIPNARRQDKILQHHQGDVTIRFFYPNSLNRFWGLITFTKLWLFFFETPSSLTLGNAPVKTACFVNLFHDAKVSMHSSRANTTVFLWSVYNTTHTRAIHGLSHRHHRALHFIPKPCT